MDDVLVSVRMPHSLVQRLREAAEHEHYLDTSEAIRSIVRKRWFAATNPELSELTKLREDISTALQKKSEREVTQRVIRELDAIKKTIKEGELP